MRYCGLSSCRQRQLSPLATRIFQIDGITGVFLGSDFVAVTIDEPDHFRWCPPFCRHHNTRLWLRLLRQGGKMTDIPRMLLTARRFSKSSTARRKSVRLSLWIWDIVSQDFEDGIVTLQMRVRQGCPSSTATLKMGIENMLRHYIPEVRS